MVINDAGHGGFDPGTTGKGMREKDLTLEAALYVNGRLNELGIKSSCTRTTDIPLRVGSDNSQRINKVRNSGAKICLSHHYNAGGGNGAETIHSIFSDGKLAKMILDEMKAVGHPIRRAFSRKGTGNSDYYYMHRMTGSVQTVIIEYDFLDNPKNDNIKSKDYRIKLYEAVVKAVCRYLGVKYTVKNNTGNSTNTKTDNGKSFYRVITGSFTDRDNANKRINELKKLGFDSFIEVKNQ